MAGDRRGHAEPRIGVDVGRADEALHQLVGDVIVLGQQLAGDVEGDRIRTVLGDCLGEFLGDQIERRCPSPPACRRFRDAARGRPAPSFRRAPSPSSRVCRNSPDGRDRRGRRPPVRGDLGQHAATHPAIGAGRPHLGCCRLLHVNSFRRQQQFAERDRDAAVLDPHRDRLHRAFVGAERLAGFERDHPIVQRAGHRRAMHDALAQRPALVRAMILDGEDAVVMRAEDADLALRGLSRSARRAAGCRRWCRCRTRSSLITPPPAGIRSPPSAGTHACPCRTRVPTTDRPARISG